MPARLCYHPGMLQATDNLIRFIEAQRSKVELAKRWGVAPFTVYKILKRESDVNGSTIAKILEDTGFDFDAAFEQKK